MANRDDIEDGSGWGGLVPDKNDEKQAQTIAALTWERNRLAGALAVCGVIAREGDGTVLPEYETDSVLAVRTLLAECNRLREATQQRNKPCPYCTDLIAQRDYYQERANADPDLNSVRLFGEIMAIMHGDGGHYLQENGAQKAYDDAVDIRSAMLIRIDALERASLRSRGLIGTL